MFLLSEIRIWTVPSTFWFIFCMIIIIDWGHSAVYIPSRSTGGSLWSLLFFISFPAEELG